MITAHTFVSGSIRKPGYYSSGIPVDETPRFRKNAARFQHLDEFVREVRRQRGQDDHEPGPENEE